MKKMRGGDYMEPNKELKFGGPSKGRRRATRGNLKEETERNSPNPPASAGGQGTPVGSRAARETPYSNAKQRDSNLDSYIKERNQLRDSGKKGSSEYNAVQNKINKAYGKGPTNRPTNSSSGFEGQSTTSGRPGVGRPTNMGTRGGQDVKTIESRGPKQLENKSAPTRTIQTRTSTVDTSPTTPSRQGAKPSKENKIKARTEKKIGNIQDRRAKAADRQADRQFNKNERQGAKADRKNERLEKKDDRQLERGAKSVQKQQNKSAREDQRMDNKDARLKRRGDRQERGELRKEGRAMVKQARRTMKKGGLKRKKAVTGMAVQAGGAALQGIGKLTDAIAGKETKFGKIANTVGSTATQVGGMMGGIPGAQNLVGGAMNAVPTPGGADAAAQPNAAQQPDPNAAANASVEQAANQPMRRGGKALKGRYKAKSGFGMLSVKAGIDNNPNPTRADAIAGAKKGKGMQDRRKGKRR